MVASVDSWVESDDLVELAHAAADAGDFATAVWVNRFAAHLRKHGRLSRRQQEVVEKARARYADLAEAWLR